MGRGHVEPLRDRECYTSHRTTFAHTVFRQDVHRAMLFRRAAVRHLQVRHLQYSAWAADGQGIDHHLFGLKRMLAPGEDVPEIYTEKALNQTSHWELSTSQLVEFLGWLGVW